MHSREHPHAKATQHLPTPEDSAEQTGGFLGILKRAAEASIIFAALLYVIGWSTLEGYYKEFGLKFAQLGVSNEDVIVSSFQFIFHSVLSTTGFCLGILLVGLLGTYAQNRLKGRREWLAVIFLLAIFAFAGTLWHQAGAFGRETASYDMLTTSTHLPRVEVEIDEAKVSDRLIHASELESKQYRLLLQTENRIWLFKSVGTFKGVFSVVTLPKEVVRVMTIERGTP